MPNQLSSTERSENSDSIPLIEQLQRYVQLQAEIEQHLEASPELSELLDAIRSGEGWFDFTRFF